jgi:Protein of unknown function (DUF2800)
MGLTLTGHNLYSPSAAHRWMACPASWAAERLVPDRPPGPAAAEGTAMHSIAAKCIETGMEPESVLLEAAPLRLYTDLVQRVAAPADNALFVEHHVNVTSVHPDLGGTVDAAVVEPGQLSVFDLKFGQGVYVPAINNPQAAIYALGMLDYLPKTTAQDIELVTMVIVQPRWHDEDDRIRVWNVSAKELHQWCNDILRPAIAATRASQLRFNAGPHCKFCRYRHVCPTLEAYERQIVTIEHDGLPNEILADLLHGIPQVEARITALRDLALDRAKQGQTIPGYRLEETYSHRKWRDEEIAEKALLAAGLRELDLYETKLYSPARIEKLLGKRRLEVMPATIKEVTGVKLVIDAKPKVPNLPTWAI